jgi:hypothetical protein
MALGVLAGIPVELRTASTWLFRLSASSSGARGVVRFSYFEYWPTGVGVNGKEGTVDWAMVMSRFEIID